MSFKDTKAYSVLANKCPHCHEGNFFKDNNPYNLKVWWHMNPKCPVCGEDFKRETGFYFGAVYVSYALTVAFGLALFALLCVAFSMEIVPFLVVFSVFLIVLLPVFYRLARLIWINIFVKYKGSKDKGGSISL
jgi:uncharacterized protein (DUF983 family)